MRTRATALAFALVAGLSLGAIGISPTRAADPAPTPNRTVEVFSPNGSIDRVAVTAPEPSASRFTAPDAEVVPVHVTGPSANRFDIVFVGDGYTADEMTTYSDNVASMWAALSGLEPWSRYQDLVNVWQVNVISAESGVDNDPTQGIERDTALDGEYFCYDLDRLLCVDETKAAAYAALAPEADHVLAVANSSTYGGSGGTIAVAAGGNLDSSEILRHELGHSVAGLADEYDDYIPGDVQTYHGSEPVEPNTTSYQAEEMTKRQAKWWRWLGAPSPDGGSTGTYEGSGYFKFGQYRPSENSLMRSLGKPFNLPSREAMTHALYDHFGTIDSTSPHANRVRDRGALTLTPIPVSGLRIEWRLDGRLLRDRTNKRSLPLRPLRLKGRHTVTVTVRDQTDFVRDPALQSDLSDSVSWTVRG